MLSNEYKKALVTGASSGIGKATVELLVKNKFEVYALARRKKNLLQLSKETGCKILPLDITDTAALQSLKNIKFDILVNNAGLGKGFEPIHKTRSSDIKITVDTNINAFLQLIRCVVPNMIKNKKGHIINIGSIAGLYPLHSSVYGGTKGAVHLINQNLRLELLGTGIRCTEINPGRVDTEFFDVAFKKKSDANKMKKGLKLLSPKDIADNILYAIKAPAHVNISLIEVTPTEQSPGGVSIKKVK